MYHVEGDRQPVQPALPLSFEEQPSQEIPLPQGEYPSERLAQLGADALALWELLAIVIGTGKGNAATFALARTLTAAFDNLQQLYVTPVQALSTLPGMNPTKAVRVHAAFELGRRLMASTTDKPRQITSPASAAAILMPDMMLLEQEHMRLILLNTRNEIISTPTLYKGSLNTAVVRVAEVFKDAIRQNAAGLIVSHNHPSGDPAPSPEDIHLTRTIVDAGKLLGIQVLDHIIIGRQRYVSLKEKGLAFSD